MKTIEEIIKMQSDLYGVPEETVKEYILNYVEEHKEYLQKNDLFHLFAGFIGTSVDRLGPESVAYFYMYNYPDIFRDYIENLWILNTSILWGFQFTDEFKELHFNKLEHINSAGIVWDSNITSVYLPKLTQITSQVHKNPFSDCKNLTNIYLNKKYPDQHAAAILTKSLRSVVIHYI